MIADTAAGRILSGVGGLYRIDARPGHTILLASARGLFRKSGFVPTAGDIVDCQSSGDPDRPWRIMSVRERKNFLIRPSVANLDGLIIIVSAADPPPDFLLVDKMLALSLIHGIEPLICLTKTDLSDPGIDRLDDYRPVGCRLIETNLQNETGLEALKSWIHGKTVCMAGQSGVGKSTLLNRLFGSEQMAVGELSLKIGRGRHTTREVVFFPFAGGYLADTPGFSSLELYQLGITGSQLPLAYPELADVGGRCRFSGCRHVGELGCAVTACAIAPERLRRYRDLREQLDSINPWQSSRRQMHHDNLDDKY